MKNRYSFSETVKTGFSLFLTKLLFPSARLIRRPLYLRGKKSLVGGKKLTTGRFCRFDLDGQKKTLFLGEHIQMGDMTHIVALENVTIGNHVLIASKCFISDTSHGATKGDHQESPAVPPAARRLCTRPVSIGNNVWIGENAVILSGATVGDGCIIAANAVVSGVFGKGLILAGAPAKAIKQWNDKTKSWEKIPEEEQP